jgi:predicted HD superfamily hydrolase involved in NAD metabolism
MLSYEEIYKIVEERLSEYRFYHSKCVMERAVEYAKIYGVDTNKAQIAGICHDIAKEIPKEDRIITCEKYGVELDEVEKKQKSLIHAKLGAKIAEVEFGVDSEIANAIKYHTTGRANMSLLEKIIFIADATGVDREYADATELYELAKKDLDKAMLHYQKVIIPDLLSKDKLVHPNAIEAYNYLINNS